MLPCGPAHVEELARTAEARVYVVDGVAHGCSRVHTIRLGKRVLGVTLAGRRLVVRRSHAVGEQLQMYDLRRGRAKEHVELKGPVETVRVDRSGLAVFIAEGRVRSLRGSFSAPATGRSLRLARGQVAWTHGAYVRTQLLSSTADRRGTSLLARVDDVQVHARGSNLVARFRDGRMRTIGETFAACVSSSGCTGYSSLLVSGRYLAAYYTYNVQSDCCGGDSVLLVNLETGARRQACGSEPFEGFTLDARGVVACLPRASG